MLFESPFLRQKKNIEINVDVDMKTKIIESKNKINV